MKDNKQHRNISKKGIFFGSSLIISDILVLCLSFFLAFLLKFNLELETIGENLRFYYIYAAIGIILVLIIFSIRRLYNFKNLYSGMGENGTAASSIIISIFIIIILNYYFNREGYQLSRLWLIYATVISILLIIISRALVKRMYFTIISRIGAGTKTLIIGVNEEGKRIAHTFSKSKIERNEVVGLITEDHAEIAEGRTIGEFKILVNLGDIEKIVGDHKIQRIIMIPNYFINII